MSHEFLEKGVSSFIAGLTRDISDFRAIISAHGGTAEARARIGGKTTDGKLFQLLVENEDGLEAHVTIMDRDNDTAFKARTLHSRFTFTPRLTSPRFWYSALMKESDYVKVKLARSHVLDYEAGKNTISSSEKPDYHETKVRTRLCVEEGEDGSYSITRMLHDAKLSNPENGLLDLQLFVEAVVEDEALKVYLGIGLTSAYKGEKLTTVMEKVFSKDGETGIYKGKPVMGAVTEKMPANLSIMSTDDRERSRLGRVNVARLARLMPSEFTPGQVDLMILNAVEGRIATAGIWSPLVLPELRSANRK